jgi:hypothetical protein
MSDPDIAPEIADTIRQKVIDALSRKARPAAHKVALPEKYQIVPGVQLHALLFGTQEFVDYNKRMGKHGLLTAHGIATACLMGIVDAQGNLVFLEEDFDFLSSNDAIGSHCYDLARIVLHVNCFFSDDELVKELAKNSEPTGNLTSTSDSPTDMV